MASLVLLTLAAPPLALLFPQTRQAATRLLVQALSDALGARVTVGRLRPSLTGRIVIEDLAVRSDSGTDSLVVPSVTGRVSTLGLLRRRVVIPSVAVRDARCLLTLLGRGQVRLVRPRPGRDAGQSRVPSWQVYVGKASVAGTAVTVRDDAKGLVASLTGLEAHAEFVRPDSCEVSADFGLTVQHRDALIQNSHASVRGAVSRQAIVLRDLALGGAGIQLGIRGVVPLGDTSAMDVRAETAVRLAVLGAFVSMPPGLDTAGAEAAATVHAYGIPTQPSLDATAWLRNARWHGLALESLSVACTALPPGPGIAVRVYAGTPRGRLSLQARTALAGYRLPTVVPGYSCAAEFNRADVAWLARTLGGIALRVPAQASGRIVVAGPGPGCPVDSVSLSTRVAVSAGDPEATVEGRLARGTWEARLDWGGNSLRGAGTLAPRWAVAGKGEADVRQPSLLTKVLGWAPVSASLRASLGFAADPGPGHDSVALDIALDSLDWRGVVLHGTRARLLLDTAGGMLEYCEGSAEAGSAALAEHSGLGSMRGTVRAAFSADGPLRHPRVQAALAADSLHVAGYGPVAAACSVVVRRDTVTMTQLTARDSLVAVSGHGWLTLGGSRPMRLAARVLSHTTGVVGSVEAEGSTDPAALAIALRAEGLPVRVFYPWLQERARPEGALDIDIQVDGPYRDPTVSAAAGGTLTFPQGLPLALTARARLERLRLSAEAALTALDGAGALKVETVLPLRTEGGWRLDGRAAERPHVSWQVDSIDCAVFAPWVPAAIGVDGRLASGGVARLANGQWEVEGQALLSDGRVRGRADSLTVSDLRVSVAVEGALLQPSVTFSCASGTVRGRLEKPLADSSAWAGTVEDGVVALDDGRVRAGSGLLSISGSAPLSPGQWRHGRGYLAAQCRLERFPLTAVWPFAHRGISVTQGELDGEGEVQFAAGRVRPTGTLRVKDAVISVPDLSPDPGPIDAVVTLWGDSAVIEEFRCRWEQGHVHAKGACGWPGQGAWPLRLAADVRDVGVAMGPDLSVRVRSAGLTVEDSRSPYTVRGDVSLGHSTYRRDVGMADLASFIRNSSIVAPRPQASAARKAVRLDLAVRAEDPWLVDLGVVRVHATAVTVLRGTAAEPVLTGEVQLTEGTLRYLDRKFTVARGVFRQTDPGRFNPSLDIEATTEAAPTAGLKAATRYTVTMVVGGTMDKPDLAFSAQPPLSQVDIVSLLTLGRVRDRDDAALALETGSDLAMVIADRAKVLASQQLTGYATRRIEQLFRLDEVSIEGNLFAINSESGPRLSVTKQIRERLSLSYQSSFGNSTTQRFRVSLKLAPFLYLEGETDAKDAAGLDIRTKLSF